MGTAASVEQRYATTVAALEAFPHHGAQPGVARQTWLCEALGRPERHAPAVHVTGTNGKGSTARLTAALLAAAGRRVGLYTSPHLEDTTERIAIGGRPIGHDRFVALAARLWPLFEAAPAAVGEPLTHFDALTALGFVAFAEAGVDAAVVEAGLGGRWDDTNVLDAPVAVITNVDLDHTRRLGTTRAEIAVEKSGIIGPGAVAVLGEHDAEVLEVVRRRARAVGATLWRLGSEVRLEADRQVEGGREVTVRTPGARYEALVPFGGRHQAANAACALGAAEALLGAPLDDEVVERGWQAVDNPGHFELVGRDPAVVVDVAHNPHGVAALGAALDERFGGRRRVVVFGTAPGKDHRRMLELLRPGAGAVVLTEAPGAPHEPASSLAVTASAVGFGEVVVEPDPLRAVETAVAVAGADDVVVCTGSHYWLGHARRHLTTPGS